ILVARALDHYGRQARPGCGLVPVERLEIVPHVLLVEARWRRARAVGLGRPEARRVRREQLVYQLELARLVHAELELRVGDDDAAASSVLGRGGIELERHRFDALRELGADQRANLADGDVLVVRARRGLRARREDRCP